VHSATLKTEDRSICQGGSYTLPNGLPVSTSGTYSSNFISVNGCDSIILTTLTVVQSTSSNQEVTICSDQQHQLPNGTQVSLAGNYTTILQNTIGCDSIISTKVNVVTKPALNLGKDTVLCGDASLLIDITTPNAAYLWNDMSTDAVKIIQAPGLYIAQLTLSPCSPVIDSIRINVCDCQVFLPNAFSPNGDGQNDSFKPVFKCYTDPENYIFKIYNRWGQELFSTSILNDGWDGQYKQVHQNSDTYMYFVRYVNPISKQEVLKKGDLTLLR
jgi:gliding motility-associated-like protein